MRRHVSRLSLCVSLSFGLFACAGADGDPSDDPAGSEESAQSSADMDSDAASDSDESSPATDAPTGGSSASNSTLSFRRDGELVDFSGANNASYYQQNFGNHRLVVVLNDVLGDKYVSLDVTGTNGAELIPQSYDCSKPLDEVSGAKAKLTFRSGEQTWQQAAGKSCTIQITSIGAVGERITGSFSATLASKGGAGAEIVVEEGVFEVERKEF